MSFPTLRGLFQSELRTVEWTSAEREVKSDEDARIAAARYETQNIQAVRKCNDKGIIKSINSINSINSGILSPKHLRLTRFFVYYILHYYTILLFNYYTIRQHSIGPTTQYRWKAAPTYCWILQG